MNQIAKPISGGEMTTPGAPARGFESGFDQDDLIIPRAKLIQKMSPEIDDGLDVKPGEIINSLTKEKLPDVFIPIFAFKNFIRFNPRSETDPGYDPSFEPGAIIWKTNDPNDPRVLEETKFGPNGEKPIALSFINFFSYFPGVPMPVVVSFSKTSYKAGKQLLSLARFSGGDMFSRKYKIGSKMEEKDGAKYAVFTVAAAGEAGQEEFNSCERLWSDFSPKVKDIQVHDQVDDSPNDGEKPAWAE